MQTQLPNLPQHASSNTSLAFPEFEPGTGFPVEPQSSLPDNICTEAWLGNPHAEAHLVFLLGHLLISHSFDECLFGLASWTRRELAQEAMDRFKRTRRTTHCANEGLLSATLMQITRNIAREYRLRSQPATFDSLTVDQPKPSPPNSSERSRRKRKGLSAIHVQILELSEGSELTYSEIATRLNLKVGTVKSRLNRARKNRERLKLQAESPDGVHRPAQLR